jgi:Zn-dependent protease with chaperone function
MYPPSVFRSFLYGCIAFVVVCIIFSLLISPVISVHPGIGALVIIVILIFILSSIANNVYNKKYEPLDKAKYPGVYRLTGEVCSSAGIPFPQLSITDDSFLNVMTLGFSPVSAKIIFTKLFLDNLTLSEPELKSVIAHEVGHIVHKDYIFASILSFVTFSIHSFGTFLKNSSLNAVRWGSKNATWLIGPILGFFGFFFAMAYMFRKDTLTYIIALLVAFILVLFIIWIIIFTIFLVGFIGLIIIGAAYVCSFFVNQFSKQCEYAADSYAKDLMGNSTPLSSALIKIEVFHDELHLRKNEWVKQNPNLSLRNLPVRSLIQSINVPQVDVKKYRSKRRITMGMLFNEFLFATHPLIKHRIDMAEKHPRNRYQNPML